MDDTTPETTDRNRALDDSAPDDRAAADRAPDDSAPADSAPDDRAPGDRARNPARDALVAGLTTTAYYALPDVVPSRAARFWLKTALLGAGMTTMEAMPTTRAGWEELRTSWRDAFNGTATPDGVGDTPATEVPPGDEETGTAGSSASQRAAAVGVAAVLVAAATVGTVALERWIFRRGEARAAAGVRFAHTRTGVVMGVLAAAAAFIPEPSERR